MRTGTRCSVESEQHVGRANEPILVHRVELDTLSIFIDFWPTDQRDVVIVDDIKAPFQDSPDPA